MIILEVKNNGVYEPLLLNMYNNINPYYNA